MTHILFKNEKSTTTTQISCIVVLMVISLSLCSSAHILLRAQANQHTVRRSTFDKPINLNWKWWNKWIVCKSEMHETVSFLFTIYKFISHINFNLFLLSLSIYIFFSFVFVCDESLDNQLLFIIHIRTR